MYTHPSRKAAISKRHKSPSRKPVGVHVEGLESRTLCAVFSGIVDGQLQITDTSTVDTITLDHVGASTILNGASYDDASITNGIKISVGSGVGDFDTVNILATVKPVTVDGKFDIGDLNIGKSGNTQDVLAPVKVFNFNGDNVGHLNINDSADTFARSVMLNVVSGTATITGIAPATISFTDTGADLNIRGGSGGNTFTVKNTPNSSGDLATTILFTGVGKDTVNILHTQDGGFLEIQGQNGNDQVTIGNAGSVQGIFESVGVSNSSGFSQLVVDDSADTVSRTVKFDHIFDIPSSVQDPDHVYVRGLAPGTINYNVHKLSQAKFLFGSGGNKITFLDFLRSAENNLVTTLETGTGTDTVRVLATRNPMIINGQNGLDSVNIGSDDLPGGSMTGILGSILITNPFSFTSLFLNDTVDTVARSATLSASSTVGDVSGLSPAPIRYRLADISKVKINGGSQGDTFFVRSTGGHPPIQINGLGGNDRFNVGSAFNTLDPILNPVTINGNDGFDTLSINDQGSTLAHIYTVQPGLVQRSFNGPTVNVFFSPIESLVLNKGPSISSPPLAKNLKLSKNVRAGELATLTGTLWDANADDVLSLSIDWGDGSKPSAIVPNRDRFSVSHKYVKDGTYTVRAIWTDNTGQSNFRELILRVKRAAAKARK